MNFEAAIFRGLQYLASQQNSDGGFDSFSSPSLTPFKLTYRYQTSFVPALMLSSLASLEEPTARTLRHRLAKFLIAQKSPQWTYNYWSRQSPEARAQPYPDDLDDTFCALSALVANDPKFVTPELLVPAVKILLAAETKPGGPYRTWLVSPDSDKIWLDTDLAVNANIAYFLSLASQPLPPLTAWLDRAVGKNLQSPYYPSEIPLLYYLARGYAGRRRRLLIKKAQAQLGLAKTSLDTALLASALKRLGAEPPAEIISKLLKSQRSDGSWPASAFCIDPARGGKTFYHGSAGLTTAFVLEALQLCRPAAQGRSPAAQLLVPKILDLARLQTAGLEPGPRRQLLNFLKRIAMAENGGEIIGLPMYFNTALAKPLQQADKFLQRLALANLYGWAAYTIYDDFLDEAGQPARLPIANIAHRRSLSIFRSDAPPGFRALVDRTFDAIDTANAWEIVHCRFNINGTKIVIDKLPNFGNLAKLAERSLGHTLGPVRILQAAGWGPESLPAQQIQKALKHYLIARQINDDCHDWPEDLSRGQISYVVAKLLSDAGIKPGKRELDKMMPRLQKQFWHKTLPELCQTMQRQVKLSRRALDASPILKPGNVVAGLLDGLDASIQETLASQADAEEFLAKYRSE